MLGEERKNGEMELTNGIYENLIYKALLKKLLQLPENRHALKIPMDSAEAPKLLTNYIAGIIQQMLGDDKIFEGIEEKIGFVNQVIRFIETDWNPNWDDDLLVQGDKLLSGIIDGTGKTPQQIKALNDFRPKSGFLSSNLFTGSNSDLNMQSEINLDIMSADEIYWIVAFIRFSGVRIFNDALRKFLEKPNAKLHIITTSYMGASEPKAVEWLKNLNPDKVEIKVNYDCSLDRLHAKSYIFVRNSGLSTAYIGSSNISRSALTQGLEWNIRVTNQENPQIIKTAIATFETYWNRQDFEDFDEEKFRKSIYEANHHDTLKRKDYPVFTIRPEQKDILYKLTVERNVHNSYRNLVVAATGTGKTVIAAFDYRRFCEQHPGHTRLLFIAHREEILEQSRRTFASVLNDHDFGELWVGRYVPTKMGNLDHLFISIQTFNSNRKLFESFGSDYYDMIIIDECHHSQASSYRILFSMFAPQLLVGLTATPERADGLSLLPDFNNRIAAEMRLPEAINRMLLVPFQYFCIGDQFTSLSHIAWKNGGYDEDELYKKLNTADRLHLITQTIPRYLSDENRCRALCFCIRKEHARDMAVGLCKAGYRADYLTGDDNEERRKRVLDNFRERKINYLCVVDLLNEGVDIPEIDTVLFLRPTKSLTIFLQQLGRGLRLSPDKDCLTVLDYVSQANRNYSYESRIRALVGRTSRNILDEVSEGFSLLPRGCSIMMDKLSRQYVLENLKGAIFNLKRLQLEVQNYRLNFTDSLELGNFLAHFNLDIRVLYKVSCWSKLKRRAGIISYPEDKNTEIYEANMKRMIHWNDLNLIHFVQKLIADDFEYDHTATNEKYALMLYYGLYREGILKTGYVNVDAALKVFGRYPYFVQELREMMDYLDSNLNVSTERIPELGDCPLALFGCYTREEQLILYGKIKADKSMIPQAGLYNIKEKNTELLWVTLNKSDKDFSPSTQYNDYAINEKLFHWQSQNTASHDNAGCRYVTQKQTGKKFLLFVRENKKDAFGFTTPYYCLGLVDYVKSVGDRPMNITWRLHHDIPGFILNKAMKLAVG
jgi:superfamily II DNA or RNA helicase